MIKQPCTRAWMFPVWGALMLAALGCTLLPLRGGMQSAGHFENDQIAFDYPANWDTADAFFPNWQPYHDSQYDADVVAIVAKQNTNTPFEKFSVSCAVMRRPLPEGLTLEQVMAETYAGMSIAEVITEEVVTVGGIRGHERVYMQYQGEPLWQVRETWLEQGGQITIVRCKSFPDQFEEARADFEAIMDSLEVK